MTPEPGGRRDAAPVLRPAAAADVAEVAEVFLASRRDALPYLPAIHADDETRRHFAEVVFPAGGIWVAVVDGCIAGFAVLAGRARERVDHLYVRPGWYGRGIGSALLAKVKDLSPGGLRLFTFQRNARARAFYEARGFTVVDTNDGSRNEEREPDILYEWVRPAPDSARRPAG